MAHPFFRNINWADLKALKIKPPYKPTIKGSDNCSNIDTLFTSENIKETPEATMTNLAVAKANFVNFTYD